MQMRWIDYLSFDLTSRSCKIAQNADEKNGTQKISWNRLGTYKFASSSLLHSLLNFIANHGVYLELWEHSTSEIDNNVNLLNSPQENYGKEVSELDYVILKMCVLRKNATLIRFCCGAWKYGMWRNFSFCWGFGLAMKRKNEVKI